MARAIDTTAVIEWIRIHEQGSNPGTPAAGYWYMFIKTDGLYIKDDAGNVTGPFGTGTGGGADILQTQIFS